MSDDYATAATGDRVPEHHALVDGQGVQVAPHECENADGARVRYLLVDLDDSSTQLLCAACMMGMFVAVAMQLAGQQEGTVSDTPGGGA